MRLIMCGPRDLPATPVIPAVLRSLKWDAELREGELGVIHGAAARGADRLVDVWCSRLGITIQPCPADWQGPCDFESGMCQEGHRKVRWDGTEYCPSAGIRRNQEMLSPHRGADAVVAFRHKPLRLCRGTADMLRRAEAAELPTLDLDVTELSSGGIKTFITEISSWEHGLMTGVQRPVVDSRRHPNEQRMSEVILSIESEGA